MRTVGLHNIISYALFSIMMLCGNSVSSQYLRNPSLDDNDGVDGPPSQWATFDDWSNPNIWKRYDIPGTTISYTPVDGSTFALFRSRGATYNESFFEPYQREYIFQELAKPLETHSCFIFKASMCYNPYHTVQDTEYPDTALPLKFQVWGGTAPGDRQKLLVDTDPIDNIEWEEFTYYFSTKDISYSHVLIEVQFDTFNVFPRAYNGYILVDNLKLEYGGTIDTIAEHSQYYHGDNNTMLTPTNSAERYYWWPEEYVRNPQIPNTLMTQWRDTLFLELQNENECPVYELFHIILDCDTLYPQSPAREIDVYYKYEEDIFLDASDGVVWNWYPTDNLSNNNVQSPRLIDYNEFYNVEVTDRYNCEFEELFNVILNCDSLLPGGYYIALDTLLTEETEVELRPVYGTPVSAWEPNLYLDFEHGVYPTANPQSDISYNIEVVDKFDCQHTEFFNFDLVLNIPNVITPNGDEYNQCFKPFGVPHNATMHLFDKTGRKICSIPDFNELRCWEGTDESGNALKTGTYWYAFESPEEGTIAKGYLFIKR